MVYHIASEYRTALVCHFFATESVLDIACFLFLFFGNFLFQQHLQLPARQGVGCCLGHIHDHQLAFQLFIIYFYDNRYPMPQVGAEVLGIIITATLVVISLSCIVVMLIINYKRKQEKYLLEKEVMHQQFQAELIQAQIEVQEQTRKNIASDMHDNIGQVLSLTNVTLASIRLGDLEKSQQKIIDAQQLVARSIKELRQLSKFIHGEHLVRQGLVETIGQEVSWLERNGHYTVTFRHNLPEMSGNNDKDLFLYRLLQESLNNILKHSGASEIQISLHYAENTMQLTVSDNGEGFDVEKEMHRQTGLGLANMRKRALLLHGQMHVVSTENGTSTRFIIPYP
jgi:signal transduction histidine kinase